MPNEPIEITPKDIIKRPLVNAAIKAVGDEAEKADMMEKIKKGVKQFKEIKDTLDQMGVKFDLGNFLGLGGGNQNNNAGLNAGGPPPHYDGPANDNPQPQKGVQQLQNFIKLLQLRYGDITLNEVLEALKKEYGDFKLSKFQGFFKQ